MLVYIHLILNEILISLKKKKDLPSSHLINSTHIKF